MWRLVAIVLCVATAMAAETAPEKAKNEIRTGDQLVSSVLTECSDMGCVKDKVMIYLNNLLNLETEDARSYKNVDTAMFKRIMRVLKTREFRYKLPEMLFDGAEIVYNAKTGLDVAGNENESRGVLKKKLLLPVLLLLKLKLKALMPIFVALIGIKALKALVLSKLAITLVLGFIIYQLCKKAGMPMPMMMPPPDHHLEHPPPPSYGPPSTSPPSSYEPSWDSHAGGPYSRVWSPSDSAQSMAYSAYYPAPSESSSTSRPIYKEV